jgi:hypothetical protein
MGAKTQGRRVASLDDIRQPGDYFGPTSSYTGGLPAVFFLKPNARPHTGEGHAPDMGHVCSPPHTFIEHPDGSLEIQPSISNLVRGQEDGPGDGWHGWLRPGHTWEE